MNEKKRIKDLAKREIRKDFRGCIKVYRKRKRAKKNINLFFELLKGLESTGRRFEKPQLKISSEKILITADIYSWIPVFEQEFLKSILEKKVRLILNLDELSLKTKTKKEERLLMEGQKKKKKTLLKHIKGIYKDANYIQCW